MSHHMHHATKKTKNKKVFVEEEIKLILAVALLFGTLCQLIFYNDDHRTRVMLYHPEILEYPAHTDDVIVYIVD